MSGGRAARGWGPRTAHCHARAIYDRKTRWALKDEGEWLHRDWRTNYSSLQDHEEQVLRQYEEEIRDGLMAKTSLGEAPGEYGENLVIAATGAIAKKGSAPGGEVRVIYDGTRGVFLSTTTQRSATR